MTGRFIRCHFQRKSTGSENLRWASEGSGGGCGIYTEPVATCTEGIRCMFVSCSQAATLPIAPGQFH